MPAINLISNPRNLSTALMYAFAQRPGTQAVDEPYYAFYLLKTGIWHPGREDILASMPHQEDTVSESLLAMAETTLLFIKNMAHHIMEMQQPGVFEGMKNVVYIRDPKKIIASYAQVIEQPTMKDIGIEDQYQIFENLRENGAQTVVFDASLLVENPETALKALCHALDIPYFEDMLSWPAGPKKEDGVWAKHWYANAHKSTGFHRQATSSRELPKHLFPLYDKAREYYEALLPFSLQP